MKKSDGVEVQHHGFFSMATRFDIVLAGMGKEAGENVAERLRKECSRIEDLLSIHRPDSPLSLLNTAAHAGPVQCERELKDILLDFKHYHNLTLGYFDPGYSTGSDTETGTETIQILDEGIVFGSRKLKLDAGGYGKGYAVQCLLPMLEEAGVKSALMSFGESLIYGYGSHPCGKGWPVRIPHEQIPGEGSFNLENEALSVSGNTLNNRKKFANSGHIVNPMTGQTRLEAGIVCVKSKDPVMAEVFSTALFSAGKQEGERLLHSALSDLDVRWLTE